MWMPKGRAEQARLLDAQQIEDPGPLHGIPISVKEHIAVVGMPLMALLGDGRERTAHYDDLAVTRLRSAGAIIVGTNTMMGTSAPGPFQFNWEREARNPWDPSHAPGWSSSAARRPPQPDFFRSRSARTAVDRPGSPPHTAA